LKQQRKSQKKRKEKKRKEKKKEKEKETERKRNERKEKEKKIVKLVPSFTCFERHRTCNCTNFQRPIKKNTKLRTEIHLHI